MVRLAFALALVALCAVADASELPRRMGMYPARSGAALAMLDSKLDVSVRGPIVETVVTQTFRNDTDRVTEATYIFPLPADAAVSAMAIKVGTRTIHAAIEPRAEAQRRYEQAVAAGLGAALLDQERPDVFTQTVSAIPAHGTVIVTLRYDSVASYHDGTWELVLPMVVAPRYVPGTASGRPTTGTGRAADTDRSPDASRITPSGTPGGGGKTEVALGFADTVDDVASPTHDLVKTDRSYAFTDPKSDHDAIIRWHAHASAAGWVEQDDDGGYAAVIVEAPPAKSRTGALRCMLVIDRAATTRGDADAVEHPLVRALLGALGANDTAAISGSDHVDWRAPDQALHAIEQAWSKPAGAFDLQAVLTATRADGAAIVLVSDGLVADDRAVIAAASRVGAPIHVIGIGPAPNRSLLAQIAATTGGTVRFASIGDDVLALSRDVLADAAAQPAALTVNWGTLAASDVVPASLPRLGAGQASLVVARVKKPQAANARVRGDVFLLSAITSTRAQEGATTPRGVLARRWGRVKLDELIARGNQAAITAHALHYGLVSPMTSMVAIGDELVVQGGVKHSVAVPVSVPAGMHWQAVQDQTSVDTTVDKDSPRKQVTHERKPDRQPPADSNKLSAPKEQTGKQSPKLDAGGTGDAASADEAEDDDARRSKSAGAPTTIEPATRAREPVAMSESYGSDEPIALEASASPRQVRRLALALGAGVAIEHGGADAMTALTGRFDVGARTRFGVEGSLWLVGGLHAQGEALISIARRGIARVLELRAGFGVHLGGGVGPAFELTLRGRLPIEHLGAYLRYDGALLFHDQTRDGQNAASVGLEATF